MDVCDADMSRDRLVKSAYLASKTARWLICQRSMHDGFDQDQDQHKKPTLDFRLEAIVTGLLAPEI